MINGNVLSWTQCHVVSCRLPAAVTLFLEFWKRYQAKLEYQWDTVEFLEQEEPSRPEYEAKCIYERKNPITGVNQASHSSPANHTTRHSPHNTH